MISDESITDQTVLISIMAVNNEIGTIADIEKIGEIAHAHNVIFHTDASQAVGHIPIDVKKTCIDLMSFSSHKICGPKGIGALFIRSIKPRINIQPLIYGGGQERNIRSGTLNVPNIVSIWKRYSFITKRSLKMKILNLKIGLIIFIMNYHLTRPADWVLKTLILYLPYEFTNSSLESGVCNYKRS